MSTFHSELCTQSPSSRQTHSKGRGLGIRTRTTRCHGRPQASLTHFPSTSTHRLRLRSSYHSFRRHLSHCRRIYPITSQPRKPATPLSLKVWFNYSQCQGVMILSSKTGTLWTISCAPFLHLAEGYLVV